MGNNNEPYVTKEMITPAMAAEYLSHANPENRVIKPFKVREYVSDILSGNWDIQSPDNAIAFNEDGVLVNGHHRLTAIIKAGVPLVMYVWRNVSRDVRIFDRGALRTTVDTLNMSGIGRNVANNMTVAVVKYLFRYIICIETCTDSHVCEYMLMHGDDLVSATQISSLGKSGGSIARCAPLQTVAYCALRSGVSTSVIEQFFRIVNSGMQYETWQKSPIHLRNYLLSTRSDNREGLRNKNAREILCYMGDRALYDFAIHNERKTPYNKVKGFGKYASYIKKVDTGEIMRITGGGK